MNRRKIVLNLIAALLLGLPSACLAAGEILEVPASIRSRGMGETGVADEADPLNFHYNPAILGQAKGAFVSGNTFRSPEYRDWNTRTHGLAAGGALISHRADGKIHLAGAIQYTSVDWGNWPVSDGGDGLTAVNPRDQYGSLVVAGAFIRPDEFDVSAGMAVNVLEERRPPHPDQSAVAVDLGVKAGGVAVNSRHLRISLAMGMSYANLGGETSPVTYATYPWPERTRYGFTVRTETASWPAVDRLLGSRVPVLTLTTSLDLARARESWRAYPQNFGAEPGRSTIHMFGQEVSLFNVLSLRFGHLSAEEIEGGTFGLGAGLRHGRYWARFDYSRMEAFYQTRFGYGISAGIDY